MTVPDKKKTLSEPEKIDRLGKFIDKRVEEKKESWFDEFSTRLGSEPEKKETKKEEKGMFDLDLDLDFNLLGD